MANKLPFGLFIAVALTICGCSSLRQFTANRKIQQQLTKKSPLANHFTGFILYDPLSRQVLWEHQAKKHFTPASNIKILTTYACLEALPDSVPTFYKYQGADSTIWIYPLGDPTFLHMDFPPIDWPEKLNVKSMLGVQKPASTPPVFGPGWAWDDYSYSFQQERSYFPIYGNEIRVSEAPDLRWTIKPAFFRGFVSSGKQKGRGWKYNDFTVSDVMEGTESVLPFTTSDELLVALLSDTLQLDIQLTNAGDTLMSKVDTLYSYPKLQVLQLMMHRSDNFLAEQLLITCANFTGYGDINTYRNSLMEKWDLTGKIKWVDGSGLSRYNLVSPLAMAKVLTYIYLKYPWDALKSIFPAGGQSGTLTHWYNAQLPYVYAKTGTLSNNHCLSGYILTSSGKTLVFSLMNNNYLGSSNDIKPAMEKILIQIRDNY